MALERLFRARLPEEIRAWREEGLIEEDQAQRILARYQLAPDQHTASLGYMVLTGLAILCGGLALLLVISHNWEDMPRALRMSGLILLTFILNLQGVRQIAAGRRDTGIRWLFAGGLSYGASIMLIAQIYHLGEHFPDGVFWWALGVLPMALLTRSNLLHQLQLGLAIIWLFSEADYGLAWLFPLFAGAAVWQMVRHQPSRTLLIMSLFGTVFWAQFAFSTWINSRSLWYFNTPHIVMHTALGMLLFACSQRMSVTDQPWWREAGAWLQQWLLRGAMLVLLLFSFADVWDGFISHMPKVGAPSLLIFLGADLLLVFLARGLSPAKWVSLGLVAVVANIIVLGGMWLPDLDEVHLTMAIMVNLFLLAVGVRFIMRGLEIRDSQMFYSGVMLLLVLALMRYLNLIGDYLGSALLFMVAGGILFAAARYWKHSAEKQLVREVHHD